MGNSGAIPGKSAMSKQGLARSGTNVIEGTKWASFILEMTPDFVAIAQPDGQLTYINKAGRRMVGLTEDADLTQFSHADLCPEWVYERTQREWLPAALQDGTVSGEGALLTRDGCEIPVSFVILVQRNTTGDVEFISTVARDMTEQKQARQELQQRVDELNTLLDLLPVGVWIGNQDCSVISGNRAGYEMFNFTPGINASFTAPQPELPQDIRTFVDGREVSPADLPMQQVTRTGQPLRNFEHELLFPDGTSKIVYASIAPLFDEQGRVRQVIGAYADFTERKRAEESLRESEQKFSLLFEKAAFGISLAKFPEGVLLDVNEAFVTLFGYTKQEAVGKTSLQLGINPDVETRAAVIAELQQFNSVRTREMILYTKSGEARTVLNNIDLIDLGGQKYLLSAIQDITERKRTEERYRGLFTSMQEGFLLAEIIEGGSDNEIDFRYLDVNPAAERIIGLSRNQIVGKTARALIPEVRENLLQMYAQVAHTGEPAHHEIFEPMLNQHHENFLFRPAPGQVAVLFWDITERKRAEEALRRSQQRLQMVLRAGRMGWWERDLRTEETSWSDSLYDLFGQGFAGSQPSYELFLQRVYPDDRPKVQERVHRAIAERGEYSAEYRLLHPNGGVRWVLEKGRVFDDPADQVQRLVGVSLDITQRKWVEEGLRESETILHSFYDNTSLLLGLVEISEDDILHLYDNPTTHCFYGLKDNQSTTGQRASQLGLPPVAIREWLSHFKASETSKQPVQFEYRHDTARGNYWLAVTVACVGPGFSGRTHFCYVAEDVTGRKEAEIQWTRLLEQHKLQREFLEQLVDKAPIAIAVVEGQELRYTLINPAYQTIVGEAMLLLGKTYPEVFPEAAERGAASLIRQVLESGQPFKIRDFAMPIPGKAETWWEGELLPLQDQAGDTTSVLILTWEITERKRVEAALIASEARYRSLFETSRDGIVMVDMNGFIQQANPAYQTMLGYTMDELRVLTYQQLTPARWHEAEELLVQNLILTRGDSGEYEKEYIHKDGTIFPVSLRTWPVYAANGQLLGMQAFVRNITERKQVEQALRESEDLARGRLEELEAIYATAPVGLAVFDTDLRFVRINERLAEINGVPAKDHLGKTPREVVPDLAGQAEVLLKRIITTGQPVLNIEFTGQTPAQPGVKRTWIEHWVPYKDATGQISGINITAEEITERKRAEEAQHLLAETSRLLTTSLNMTDRLETVAEMLVEEFADWCALNLLADDETIHLAVAEHREPEKTALIYELAHAYPLNPDEATSTADVIRTEKAQLYHHFLEGVPAERAEDQNYRQFLDRLGSEATIIAPLITRGQKVGSITLVRAGSRAPFDEDDLALAEELAYRTAMALDNTRLYETERAARLEAEAAQKSLALLAETRERNRLAQELHDNVAQALGYLNLKLTIARDLLATNQLEPVEATLAELKQIVNETYADIRGEIFNLRTDPISEVRFLTTLREYLDKYKRFYNLEIQLIFEAEESFFNFPTEISIALIRIIQEALMNVRKHAQVNQAVIRLGQTDREWRISVEDEGRGFDASQAAPQRTSYGVNIMRERTEGIGGHLEVESVFGHGTRVTLLYPKSLS